MMPNNRAYVLLSCILALLVVGNTASAASAEPLFLDEGAAVSTAEEVTVSTAPGSNWDFAATLTGGAKVVILCEKVAFKHAFIEAAGKDKGESKIFSSCNGGTADEPVACRVKEPITISAITTELFDEEVGTVKQVWDEFKPSGGVGANFTTISITNCAGEGNYAVKPAKQEGNLGGVCFLELEPSVLALEKLWEATIPTTTGELRELCEVHFGANPATFVGEGVLVLANDHKWAADF